MITNNELIDKIKYYEDYMVKTRRYLHENPEISSKEYDTSAFLQEEVSKFGLKVVKVENSTGFYAIMDTGRPGKTIGIRTDIDALPINEPDNNLKGPRVTKSKRPGAMHACGHDGHMATVLASIQVLIDFKKELNGKIVFIFEEGEEIGSGIDQMVKSISGLGIDVIYGTHLTSFMPTGQICIDQGPRMAGAVSIELDIVGKGGHGSRPDLSINPLYGAANVLVGLASAWANQIDVSKTVTLGLTQLHCGSANNVFADSAFIGGSLRYYDYEEGKHALEVFKNVASKTAEAHLCEAKFRDSTRISTVPVINDEHYSLLAREGARSLFGDKVVEGIVWYASESFAHYSKVAPIVFAFVGVGNEEVGSGAEHHNDHFDIDEAGLVYSLGSTVKFVISNLSN